MTPSRVAFFRRVARPASVAVLTIALDQFTKWAIRSSFQLGQSLPLLPPVLYLSYVQNTGAAFGIFPGRASVLIVVALGVAGWVTLELLRTRHRPHRLTEWALSLILGGAIGNLIDRLRLGYVIDFIDLRIWPVFNLADTAISIGASLLIWQALRGSAKASDSHAS